MTTGGRFAGPFASTGSPPIGNASPLPQTLTAGPDGNLYAVGGGFVNPGAEILRIDPSNPSGVPASFGASAGLPGGAGIAAITTGADGNVWFTDPPRQSIGELDISTGKITERHVPGGYKLQAGGPDAIEPGAGNTLWFPLLGPLAPYGQGGTASQAAIGEISGLAALTKTPSGAVTISASAKVSGNGVAGVSLSCHGPGSAACSGKLTLSKVLRARVKQKGRTVTMTVKIKLGPVRYSLAAGRTKLLRVRLSRAVVRAVDTAKNRKLTVTATADPSSGSPVTETVTLVRAK